MHAFTLNGLKHFINFVQRKLSLTQYQKMQVADLNRCLALGQTKPITCVKI
ncbi:hypothetical protein A6A12_1107 [Vibrio anguillarum]|nr:hypothetical protein A6A12_1107 [Vibrio anguillarum]